MMLERKFSQYFLDASPGIFSFMSFCIKKPWIFEVHIFLSIKMFIRKLNSSSDIGSMIDKDKL